MSRLLNIRWVKQESPNGCVLASLAMIGGKTFAELSAMYPWVVEDRGSDFETLSRDFLHRHGFAAQPLWQYVPMARCPEDADHRTYWDSHRRDPWPPLPWAEAHICTVETSQYHAVVMLADGTVLDPLGPEPKRLTNYKKVAQVWGLFDIQPL